MFEVNKIILYEATKSESNQESKQEDPERSRFKHRNRFLYYLLSDLARYCEVVSQLHISVSLECFYSQYIFTVDTYLTRLNIELSDRSRYIFNSIY